VKVWVLSGTKPTSFSFAENFPFSANNQIGDSDSNSLLPCPARHSAAFDYSKQPANKETAHDDPGLVSGLFFSWPVTL